MLTYGAALSLNPAQNRMQSPNGPRRAAASSTGAVTPDDPKRTSLYKTELCRSFEESGACRYGAKCQFAHGQGTKTNARYSACAMHTRSERPRYIVCILDCSRTPCGQPPPALQDRDLQNVPHHRHVPVRPPLSLHSQRGGTASCTDGDRRHALQPVDDGEQHRCGRARPGKRGTDPGPAPRPAKAQLLRAHCMS